MKKVKFKNEYEGWVEFGGEKHRFKIEGTSEAEVKKIIKDKQPKAKVTIKKKRKKK